MKLIQKSINLICKCTKILPKSKIKSSKLKLNSKKLSKKSMMSFKSEYNKLWKKGQEVENFQEKMVELAYPLKSLNNLIIYKINFKKLILIYKEIKNRSKN
jgi:predicted transcriptional regulator